MIVSHKAGRVRTCELVPATFVAAEDWMAEQRRIWEMHLDLLSDYLESESSGIQPKQE